MKKRRWIFIIIILLVVAAVLTVVFINLFTKKDTTQVAEKVNTVVETGYLNDGGETFGTMDSFLTVVSGSSFAQEGEKCEIANYQDSLKAFVIMGDFFNRQVVFMEFSGTYKQKRNAVCNAFDDAQKTADKLKKYIDSTKDVAGTAYWQINNWASCKGDFKALVNKTDEAFGTLFEIYNASMPSKFLNNKFSKLVFSQLNAAMKDRRENVSKSNDLGGKMLKLAQNYLSVAGESTILKYYYDLSMQAEVEDILKNGKNSDFYSQFMDGTIAS